MTTYRCRTCGITWQMGPTRDMDPNEQCHCCAREGLGSTQARVAELDAQKDAGYQDGRRHTCALLSQLVYTSDGEPLGQSALLELCVNVETDYGL